MIENTSGCITHYNPKHLQLREDFLQICMYHVSQFAGEHKPKEEPNVECMAMILRVLETLTDHQRERFTFNAMYYA